MVSQPFRLDSISLLAVECCEGCGIQFPKAAGLGDEGVDLEVDNEIADLFQAHQNRTFGVIESWGGTDVLHT